MVGDPHWDRVSIYLPPSYSRKPGRRYPVLYFLHGFDADDRALIKGAYQNLNIRISMDSLIRAGAVNEMIVVMPNARNAYNGSFYTNSPGHRKLGAVHHARSGELRRQEIPDTPDPQSTWHRGPLDGRLRRATHLDATS
jgi:enterochelin esterase-like enzyme